MAREITSLPAIIPTENLPNNFIKAIQYFTFLDLVCDGAEIEGFSTPSKSGLPIPRSLLGPASNDVVNFNSAEEAEYIKKAQRDIFLNGQAIRGPNSDNLNIQNTFLSIRTGEDPQQAMTGVDELRRSETLTPAIVKNNRDIEANKVSGTVQRGLTINDTPTAIIVTLSWASLRQLHPTDGSSQGLGINNGRFAGESGRLEIYMRVDNKDGVRRVDKHFILNAVSVGAYARDYRLDLPTDMIDSETNIAGNFPLTISVLRGDLEFRANETIGRHPFADIEVGRDVKNINVYEEGSRRFTAFSFSRLQSVIPNNREFSSFPKSAYFGLRYSAEQFPQIPQRMYFIRGIKIRIPTGVSIDTATTGRIIYPSGYTFGAITGTRNGTTDKFWTTDPAWILYSLLTESYGLDLDDSKINKASFYAASVYCSTPVSGQTTPRYSFNGVINRRRKALDLIKEIASLMRATIFYKNGQIKIALDKAETVTSYFFTNANVIDGKFNYAGIEKDKKFTQINCTYFNNEIQENDQITVTSDQINTRFITSYGLNQSNIQALYTTDRDQALRLARSVLYTNLLESDIVTFDCGLEAAAVLEPFMVIKIQDRLKETIRASGRIKSITNFGADVVVDSTTNTSLGEVGDTFLIIDTTGAVQERTVQSKNTGTGTVTVSSAFNPAPQAGSIWAVKTAAIQHRKYRITNIKQNSDFTFSITALFYDENKYTFVDTASSEINVGRPPTTLDTPPINPEIQEIKEQLIVVNGRATTELQLFWSFESTASKYQVVYFVDGNGPFVETTRTNSFVIKNNSVGTYTFEVRSLNVFGRADPLNPATATFVAQGLDAIPADVTGLRSEESGDNLILRFDFTEDKDVQFGGFVKVKYHSDTTGAGTYNAAADIKEVEGNSDEIIINDYQSGEYFLKFVDVNRNESLNPVSVIVNRTVTRDDLLAAQIREDTGSFAGAKTNTTFDSNINGLRLTAGLTIDSITNFDTLATSSTTFATLDLVTAGISQTGDYTFAANVIDLAAPFRFHIEPHILKTGFNTGSVWDSFTDPIDTWPQSIFVGSGEAGETAEVTFQVASTKDSSTPTNFVNFDRTDIIARKLAFKILINNNSAYENVDIAQLGVNFRFDRRVENSIENANATNGILTSSNSGATTVTFKKKFFLGTSVIGGGTDKFKPSITVNINNAQSGDFFTLDSVSSANFVVSIKNGSSFVAREFTYNAVGFGAG